jgi:3-methyladenine DNA glycosylase/8-oxoguanine DNA glycosylase
LERIAEAMLSARAILRGEYEKLHKAVLAFVREDAVCRRLMTVPGVGPVVATKRSTLQRTNCFIARVDNFATRAPDHEVIAP